MSIPVALHPHQYLLLSVLWFLTILRGVLCYFIIVLICISLMTYEVEHLFICLFATCVSSLVRCLLKSLTYFLIGLFSYLSNAFSVSIEMMIWFLILFSYRCDITHWFANIELRLHPRNKSHLIVGNDFFNALLNLVC